MVVRFLVTAGVAGLLLTGSMGSAAAAAQEGALVSDSAFMQAASSLGLLQAKLAKIAEAKGSSADVKEFAKRMSDDYARTNEELAAAAKGAAFPKPVIMRQHQQVLDRMRRTSRGSFDRDYMAEVVRIQEEEARLYRREAQNGRVASLKQLAGRMLPSVEQHLGVANETARSVGADVTTSAAGAEQGT